MAVPNIIVFKIDEGLIHGQEQLWVKALDMNTVVVANDSVGGDSMQQTLMEAVIPKTIATRFFSIQHTCGIIMKTSPKQTISIVYKTPEDALKLVAGGVPMREINVDNIHRTPGKKRVSKYIALGGEDKTALRQLRDTYGVVFSARTTASGDNGATRVDLNKYP